MKKRLLGIILSVLLFATMAPVTEQVAYGASNNAPGGTVNTNNIE